MNVNGAPETKSVTYGTVSSSIGGSGSKCWITQNLGADSQASSATDASLAAAGWNWQFNRLQGYKHDGVTRTPNSGWIQPIVEYVGWLSGNDPCTIQLGSGWRIPTQTEWTNADNGGGWNNYSDVNNSVLKLHAAGRLNNATGALEGRGTYGY